MENPTINIAVQNSHHERAVKFNDRALIDELRPGKLHRASTLANSILYSNSVSLAGAINCDERFLIFNLADSPLQHIQTHTFSQMAAYE